MEELRTMTKSVKSLEIKLPKLKLEITGCDTTREELTKLIPELRLQCEISDEDAQKRAELKNNVAKCRSDMTSCAELAAKLEKQVSKLQKDILDAGGPRLKNQKAACEKVVSKLNDAEKSLNSSKVEVVSSEKAEAKTKAAKAELEKELENCEFLLEKKETEFKSLEEGALEVMTAYEKVKVIEAEKRSALDSASKEAEDLKKSQAEIKCVEIELLGQLDAYGKQISDSQKKMHHWEKEIARLREVEEECDYEGEDEGLDEHPKSSEDDDMDIETQEKDSDNGGDGKTDMDESKSFSLLSLSHSALEKYDPDDIKETISTLESERNLLAKNANMGAIAEYRKKEGDYLSRYVILVLQATTELQMSYIFFF
jgi:structural maintenance of chromosome 4